MICDVCQSDRLAKNDLGFMVCDDCGAQSFAATQEESEFLMGETGARDFQRIKKVKPKIAPKNKIASLSVILETIKAALFLQCCAVSNHFGVKRSLLLRTAGDLFLAYFESVRRDYDSKFELILTGKGLIHCAQTASRRLPQFKVRPFITIHMLATALNLIREPITPLDLVLQVRLGNIPTQAIPKLLPVQIASKLTIRLYQFLTLRSGVLSIDHIVKEMRAIHQRVSRVTPLPELQPISGNVPLTLTRYVIALRLPVESVAPLSHALLRLYMKTTLNVTKSHTVAVVVLAVKLLYGSRSPSALDSVLNSSFLPVSKLYSPPDCDSADLTSIRDFTRTFSDLMMYSVRTKLVVDESFDDIYEVPPSQDVWNDRDVTSKYDDFSVRDDERCLCWYEDPAHGGDQKPINVGRLWFDKFGCNKPEAPEYRRLIYYDPDEMHLGHCTEHYLHRRLFQIASDIFDIAQYDIDQAYREIVNTFVFGGKKANFPDAHPTQRAQRKRVMELAVKQARFKSVELRAKK